jgi:hypothetical protein
LKVLSVNDEDLDQQNSPTLDTAGKAQNRSTLNMEKNRSSFFKNWKKYKRSSETTTEVRVRGQTGMEGELLERVGMLNFKTQVEAFYTAYSKVLRHSFC